MAKLSAEQLRAAAELSPQELKFANLWLDRHTNGLAPWECAQRCYPNQTQSSLSVTASRMINYNDRVRRYIDVMNRKALQDNDWGRDQLVKTFKRQATTVVEKFAQYAQWRDYTDKDGQSVKLPWVPDTAAIPDELNEFVVCFRPTPDGSEGFVVELTETIDEKTRQKAAELLGKMGGEFIDRVELSGGVAVASVDIDPTDPGKAAELYKNLIKGQA